MQGVRIRWYGDGDGEGVDDAVQMTVLGARRRFGLTGMPFCKRRGRTDELHSRRCKGVHWLVVAEDDVLRPYLGYFACRALRQGTFQRTLLALLGHVRRARDSAYGCLTDAEQLFGEHEYFVYFLAAWAFHYNGFSDASKMGLI